MRPAPQSRPVVPLLHWAIAASTLSVGVISLVQQSVIRAVLDFWINVHVLFGLLLVQFCLMRLAAHRKYLSDARAIRDSSRVLSRTVYLILYAVIGLRQIVGITRHILCGEPMDFNLSEEAVRGPDFAGFDPSNDFHLFMATSLAALIVVRLLNHCVGLRATGGRASGRTFG